MGTGEGVIGNALGIGGISSARKKISRNQKGDIEKENDNVAGSIVMVGDVLPTIFKAPKTGECCK